jgi:hypothetical protein
MDEKPKSIFKKLRKLAGSFLGWLLLVTGLAFLISLLAVIILDQPQWRTDWGIVTAGTIGGAMVGLLFFFIRWLFSRRNLKRSLFGLACFATLIALLYAEEDWRGWHAWNKFKRKWEAKGEHFDFASATPPPVPDDQNFALTPVIASSYEMYFDKTGREVRPRNTNVVDRLSMMTWRDNPWATAPKLEDWLASKKINLKTWQNYFRSPPPTNSIETNSFPIAPQPQSPADDVLLALSKYDSSIEEIREASKLPYSRFPLTYNSGYPGEILLPHLAALRSCAQVLTLRALAELQVGQNESAHEDVKLSLRLIDAIGTEPFLISHLVRVGMMHLTLQPVWEGLSEHKWSDVQLAELENELRKKDFLADYEYSFRGERALNIAGIDFLQQMPEQIPNVPNPNGINQPATLKLTKFIFHLIPNAFFYQNELSIAQMHQQWTLPLVDLESRTVSPATVRMNQVEADKKLQYHVWPYKIFARMMFPGFGNAAKKSAYAQESVDLARVAIALERYRLAHGEFSESLDALAPQFMKKIPHDIINGQPLHYRRTDDKQFILYSVGWNETDDGGVVGLTKNGGVNNEKGDWVWRYPSK